MCSRRITALAILIGGSALVACAVGGGDDGLSPVDDDAGAVDAAIDTGRRDAGRSDSGRTDAAMGADTAAAPPDDAGDMPDTFVAPDAGGGIDAGVDAGTDAGGGVDSGSVCAGHGFTGTLVTWDLSAQTGSEASVSAKTSATGVTGGALTRSGGLTAVSGSGSINSSGWPQTASADPTKYYTFTIDPGAGCTVTVSSLAISTSASGTGPTKADVATSVDAFGAHTSLTLGTQTLQLSNVTGSSAIEVRVYGFAAGGSTGTFRIQNTMSVSGSIQ